MLQNYIRQLLVFAFILVSFTALGQSFGTSVSARYGDGCRLDFYNTTNVKIFSLRGSELRYWYNPSGQIIVRDENTQVTDLYGITGLAALIDSVQSVCLAGVCGGSTPVETFTYCGSPVASYWYLNDTSNYDVVNFYSINTQIIVDSIQYFNLLGNSNDICCGISDYTFYPFSGQTSLQGACEKDFEFSPYTCDSIIYYSASFQDTILAVYLEADCAAGKGYSNDSILISSTTVSPFAYEWVTVSNDTLKVKEFTKRAATASVLFRVLGVEYTDLNLDTTASTIEISAKPIKTSGQTYEASSFKIEKIAFADISAGTISGSTYNPNLGEQSNTFAMTTGKNTFKVSVEDTDGNIAYSIFQVTKTQL